MASPQKKPQSLTVIVPAYNEARTLGPLIERLLTVRFPLRLEVIVVDDGSTDGTAKEAARLSRPGLKVLRHETNRGKGAAIRTGLDAASGDLVLIQDADLEYEPEDILSLLKPALEQGAPVVYGSRILRRENRASYWRYYWGGRFISLWTNLLFGSRITDEPTCYKLFDARLLKGLGLRCTGFEFCPEATGKLLRGGVPILEVPIRYTPRTIAEGKKIRWLDGVIALWTLLKIRIGG
ncbi:MAG: glycosyltransferase family 2 protein [Elusimicrobiota bacterium]